MNLLKTTLITSSIFIILLNAKLTHSSHLQGNERANEINPIRTGLGEPRSSRQAIALYRDQNNWVMSLLKDFFVDVDWNTIATAREQVERVLGRLSRFWSAFRSTLAEPSGVKSHEDAGRMYWAKLFGSSSNAKYQSSQYDDSTNVKAMLEKIACFVGYMRLLTHTQAALADLDASKVISSLYAETKMHSNGSIFSNLFG